MDIYIHLWIRNKELQPTTGHTSFQLQIVGFFYSLGAWKHLIGSDLFLHTYKYFVLFCILYLSVQNWNGVNFVSHGIIPHLCVLKSWLCCTSSIVPERKQKELFKFLSNLCLCYYVKIKCTDSLSPSHMSERQKLWGKRRLTVKPPWAD